MKDMMKNDSAVSKAKEYFSKYLEAMDSNPRHTASAIYETELFSVFLKGAFQENTHLQDSLYERMMDCAVEFEESGFISGIMYILQATQDEVDEMRSLLNMQ